MHTKSKPSRHVRFLPLFAAIVLFALPGPVQAQDNEEVTVHEFGDADLVEGHLQSSDAAFILIRRGIRHGTLIRPRLTFVPELLKSCEDSN